MKIKLICFTLLLSLLVCFTACKEEPPTVYQTLDALLDAEVNAVTVDISTVTEGITLTAKYEITKTSVKYAVEQLSLLEGDAIPEDYKITLTGTATVENGTVTKIDGDAVDIPAYDQLTGNFSIIEGNLSDVQTGEGTFKAKVISPAAFLGTEVDAEDMTVSITYTEATVTSITLTYKTATSTVTTVYTFN